MIVQTEEGASAARLYLEMAKVAALRSWPMAGGPLVATAAVIGGGTMGTGIALALSRNGIETWVVDPSPEALARARVAVDVDTARAVAKGRISEESAKAALERLIYCGSIAELPNVDLAIEAAFERMRVKQDIMAALDRHCPRSTILATNTSTLDIDLIAASTSRPQDVVGLHFFSPAQIMPLIEIVRGLETRTSVVALAVDLARRLGKIGIVVGNCYGFAGNRMVEGMGREANRLLLEGNSPLAIDAAIRDFGMAMGPLEVADLVGIDVPHQARQEKSQAIPGDQTYFYMADLLVERGRLGRKTGRGFYRYGPGARAPEYDPAVEEIAAAAAVRLGVARKVSSAAEIVERCILPLINEGALILEEGIASRASDLDLIYTLGYGFPTVLGGPMHYADKVGLAFVLSRLEALQAEFGDYWRPAPSIRKLAAAGATITESYGANRADPVNG